MNPKRTGIVILVVAAAVFAGIIALVLSSTNGVGNTETAEVSPAAPEETAASSEEQDKPATDTAEEKKKSSGKGNKKHKDQPAPEEPKVNEALQARLKETADATGMLTCVSFHDLTNHEMASYLGDQQIASASMIKLLIAYAFLEQVQEGRQSLDAYYTLTYDDLVGGTGNLTYLGAGAQVSYRNALMRMIDVSDNVGANILIDAVGMDAINDCAARLGLTQTKLNRKMMDPSMYQGVENYTSADDLAHLLQMVYEEQFVSPEYSKLVLTALEQQEDWGGIRSGLPEGTVFAHKTGTLETVRHDGGIVEGEHPYVLVVLCGGTGYYESGALSGMARIAQVVTEALAA